MLADKKHKPSCKIWIEYREKPLIGKGGAEILDRIGKEESISKAAKILGMSYRYVWSYLKRIERTIGEPIAETFKGGKTGGGGAKLTRLGRSLLNEYRQLESSLNEALSDSRLREVTRLKTGAKNYLKGKVVAFEKDGPMAKISVMLVVPASVTAIISKEAAEKLGIKVGDQVEAIVKATEVMVAK